MTRTIALLFLLVFCFATAMHAQAQAPKPDPEVKKLQVLVGHWTFKGEYKAGPLGPGGKFTRQYTGQMILGRFFFRGRWNEKGAMGDTQGFEIDGYDPVNKRFACTGYTDQGIRVSAALTANGKALNWEGKAFVAAEQYGFKEAFVFDPELMSGTATAEISADGRTWMRLYEAKFTKVKTAPKK
jgi:hypothetical protein